MGMESVQDNLNRSFFWDKNVNGRERGKTNTGRNLWLARTGRGWSEHGSLGNGSIDWMKLSCAATYPRFSFDDTLHYLTKASCDSTKHFHDVHLGNNTGKYNASVRQQWQLLSAQSRRVAWTDPVLPLAYLLFR